MVPIVYPEDMKVAPCNETAGAEKQKQVKLGTILGNLSQSLKTQVAEAQEEDKKTYHKPSDKVRARLKSEHLSFLQRQDLETTAIEYYELQEFLEKLPDSERQKAIQNEEQALQKAK